MTGTEPQPHWEDTRPSLLIADDDPVVAATLTAQLDGDFHIVGVAEDAAEVAELAGELRPDAVLLDVEMPAGGAREAVPGILARAPGTCIVVLSGDESRASVLELLNAGAAAYLRKGISSAEITRTILEALKVSS